MKRQTLTISITRNDQKVSLPMILCTKDEITGYFHSLSHGDLLAWTFLLAGYACGADSVIDDLEKRIAASSSNE